MKTSLERTVLTSLVTFMVITGFSIGVYMWDRTSHTSAATMGIRTTPPDDFKFLVTTGSFVVENWTTFAVIAVIMSLIVGLLHLSMRKSSDEHYANMFR